MMGMPEVDRRPSSGFRRAELELLEGDPGFCHPFKGGRRRQSRPLSDADRNTDPSPPRKSSLPSPSTPTGSSSPSFRKTGRARAHAGVDERRSPSPHARRGTHVVLEPEPQGATGARARLRRPPVGATPTTTATWTPCCSWSSRRAAGPATPASAPASSASRCRERGSARQVVTWPAGHRATSSSRWRATTRLSRSGGGAGRPRDARCRRS